MESSPIGKPDETILTNSAGESGRFAMTNAVFAYGTLKRGQCRASLWPARPLSIQPAHSQGQLYGRPDYPAMTSGDDQVHGELWMFDPDDMTRVLDRLDEIEGTNQPGQPDLYLRVQIDVLLFGSDKPISAWTYHYASDPSLDGFELLVSNGDGVQWP